MGKYISRDPLLRLQKRTWQMHVPTIPSDPSRNHLIVRHAIMNDSKCVAVHADAQQLFRSENVGRLTSPRSERGLWLSFQLRRQHNGTPDLYRGCLLLSRLWLAKFTGFRDIYQTPLRWVDGSQFRARSCVPVVFSSSWRITIT